jgi:transcriptional antiterminator NusG
VNLAAEPAAPGAEPEHATEPAAPPLEAEHAPEPEVEDAPVPAPSVSGDVLYGLDFSEEEVGRLAAGVAAEAAEAAEAVPPMSIQPAVEAPEAPAAVSEPALVEEADDGRRWYVVHCYSGYENKVRHNLEQRIESMGMKGKIFDVVVPTEEELEVREGKRRTVERRVFPGYILVQMVMSEESWYVVRNTPGVTGFVGMGNEPTPLRPEEVAQIVKRMEAEAPRVKVTFKAGQKVRIIDGPFNDFIGTVDALDMEKAKVRVMVSFFGRETPVELDFLQVEKA